MLHSASVSVNAVVQMRNGFLPVTFSKMYTVKNDDQKVMTTNVFLCNFN